MEEKASPVLTLAPEPEQSQDQVDSFSQGISTSLCSPPIFVILVTAVVLNHEGHVQVMIKLSRLI